MGVFMFFMRQTIIVMSRMIEYDQRNELFKHYEILSSSFYKRSKVGDLMSRIVEDVNKVRTYLGPTIMYFIGTISLFIMTIIAMMRVSPMLTLFSLLPLPILSFVIYYVSSRVSRRSIAISKQMSVLTTLAQESYSCIRLIKTYPQEAAMGAQFSDASDDFKQKTLSLARLQAVSGTAIVFLMGISTILTIYVGGRLAIENKISFGNIAEFVIYVGMLAFPVISLGWIASLIAN
jgi:ATP-binding cassette subfamily B protein